MNGDGSPIEMAWLAAVLEPRDVAPHPNFRDDSYDAKPTARLAAVMVGDPWRVRRAAELAPGDDNDPAALATKCLDADTIASGIAELDLHLERLNGADLAQSSALTLILCAAAAELDDFDTCLNALDRQLRRLEHPKDADRTLLRAILPQQRALRLCDTSQPFVPVCLEVGRLLRDLDASDCSSFITAPGGQSKSGVTFQRIYESLIDSAVSLPGASAADELATVGLPSWQERVRSMTPSLLRRKDSQDARRYTEFVSHLFKQQFGRDGQSIFGVTGRSDLFYNVLALEVAGHGAVYASRKDHALLRLVQWSGDVDDLADTLRLLRQAGAKNELELVLRRLAASGPLTALGRDARQILLNRTKVSRLRTVEIAVLRSAADLLAPAEARLALDLLLASLSVGGPPDLPGSWQLPLLRHEAAWIAAAEMANVCDAVDEVAHVLLRQGREVDSLDPLFDGALRRAATTLDWAAASEETRQDWRRTMRKFSGLLPSTSEGVLLALGDPLPVPVEGAAPWDDLIHRLNALIRGQAGASEMGEADVARVADALESIRHQAASGLYASSAVSVSDVAAALVAQANVGELWSPLTDFLLDPNVVREHKAPAFERLARAELNVPAAVASKFRSESPDLLNSARSESMGMEVVPFPAALRFLGAHRLRSAGEILGWISTLAASADRHARREAAVTISVLASTAPSPSLLALCVSLSRDADVDVRANAGRALADLRHQDDSLAVVATGRLLQLLDEDGLQPPLVVLAALDDLDDLPPEVRDKVSQLASEHPSRSVRQRAAHLLED